MLHSINSYKSEPFGLFKVDSTTSYRLNKTPPADH